MRSSVVPGAHLVAHERVPGVERSRRSSRWPRLAALGRDRVQPGPMRTRKALCVSHSPEAGSASPLGQALGDDHLVMATSARLVVVAFDEAPADEVRRRARRGPCPRTKSLLTLHAAVAHGEDTGAPAMVSSRKKPTTSMSSGREGKPTCCWSCERHRWPRGGRVARAARSKSSSAARPRPSRPRARPRPRRATAGEEALDTGRTLRRVLLRRDGTRSTARCRAPTW